MANNQHQARRRFLGWLAHPETRFSDTIETDFDEDTNCLPVTGEPLDWHECRQWPAPTTD